jgi:hypothetical protein
MLYEKALTTAQNALELRKKSSMDQNSIEIAESLSQIAKCYKALSYDHKALEHEK